MARLPDIDPVKHPDIAAALAKTEESRGFVSNLMRLMAHAPGAQKANVAYGHFLRFETDLTELQRELVISATVRGVPFAWAHHVGLICQLGFSRAQAETLKAGQVPEGLSPADQAVCRFAFAYSACKGVPDGMLADLRRHFSNQQILEMSLLSGYYLSAGALLIGFDVELEPPEVLQLELDLQTKRLKAEAARAAKSS